MHGENIRDRTVVLAKQVLSISNRLAKDYNMQVLCHQVVRSSTSVGANYRAACRSKSRKDFINKLKMVEEELDETLYWLGLIRDSAGFNLEELDLMIDESRQLLAIIVKSILTARKNGL